MTTGRTIDTAFEGQALPPCCGYFLVIFHTQRVEVRVGELERDQVARWALGVLADGQSEVLGSGPKPISVAMPPQEVFEVTQAFGGEHTCFAAVNERATLFLVGRAAMIHREPSSASARSASAHAVLLKQSGPHLFAGGAGLQVERLEALTRSEAARMDLLRGPLPSDRC